MTHEQEQAFWVEKLQGLQAADYDESRSSYQYLVDTVAGSEPITEAAIQEAWIWESGLDTAGQAGLSQLFGDLGDYLRRRREWERSQPQERQ